MSVHLRLLLMKRELVNFQDVFEFKISTNNQSLVVLNQDVVLIMR